MTHQLHRVGTSMQGSKKQFYTQLTSLRDLIKRRASTDITFSSPLIERHGQGIIYPRTINVIQGKTGVHKSRLVEDFCAALLNTQKAATPLGFTAKGINREKLTVLYVDTERNINEQFPYAIQQIKRKSGFGPMEDVPGFDFISLIATRRDERLAALSEYLLTLRHQSDHHLFIVLDVITDCLSNFNDPSESMRLTDLMNTLINEHDVTFLCVIHENPNENSSKARGHLGTELCNKASCQLQIGFEKDGKLKKTRLVKVNFLKTRMSRQPEPLYLKYCEQSKGLISAGRDLISKVADSRRTKATMQEVFEALKQVLNRPRSRQQTITALTNMLKCGSRTVISRLKLILESQTALENAQGQSCRLTTLKQGREVSYQLLPVQATER